jgi:hypothetical protein
MLVSFRKLFPDRVVEHQRKFGKYGEILLENEQPSAGAYISREIKCDDFKQLSSNEDVQKQQIRAMSVF